MTAAEGTGDQGGPSAPPDNPDALVEEINRTREELGNTVEALAAKVNVKARAQQKATEVSGQLKSKVRDVTQGLSGKAGQLKDEVTDRAAGARQAVAGNGTTVLGEGQPVTKTIAGRATQAGASAQSAATRAGAPPGRRPPSRSSSGPGGPRPPSTSTGYRSRPPWPGVPCCWPAGSWSGAAGAESRRLASMTSGPGHGPGPLALAGAAIAGSAPLPRQAWLSRPAGQTVIWANGRTGGGESASRRAVLSPAAGRPAGLRARTAARR